MLIGVRPIVRTQMTASLPQHLLPNRVIRFPLLARSNQSQLKRHGESPSLPNNLALTCEGGQATLNRRSSYA